LSKADGTHIITTTNETNRWPIGWQDSHFESKTHDIPTYKAKKSRESILSLISVPWHTSNPVKVFEAISSVKQILNTLENFHTFT
jgi:hypothetical protein